MSRQTSSGADTFTIVASIAQKYGAVKRRPTCAATFNALREFRFRMLFLVR
jgi:hypothetical protein